MGIEGRRDSGGGFGTRRRRSSITGAGAIGTAIGAREDLFASVEDLDDSPAAAAVAAKSEMDELAERRKIRLFRYRVTKVLCTFEEPIAYPFVRFEFGGVVSEFETEDLRVKITKVKKEDEEGNEVEEVKENQVYRKAANLIGKRKIFFTSCMKNVKQKMETEFPIDFSGVWGGTYADLRVHQIRIELWNRTFFGGNDLIGKTESTLVKLANGTVDQRFEFASLINPNELSCVLKFKCEFQEIFDFVIDVRAWEMQSVLEEEGHDFQLEQPVQRTFKNPVLKFQAPRAPFKDSFSRLARKFASMLYNHPFQGHIPALLSPLSFWLPYRQLPLLTDMSRTWEDTSSSCFVGVVNKDAPAKVPGDDDDFLGCCEIADNLPELLKLTKHTDGNLHYNGTRTDLENEFVSIQLNDDAGLVCGRRPLKAYKAFQGVLDYGYMSIILGNGRDHVDVQGEIYFRPPGPLYRQHGNLEYAAGDTVNMIVTIIRGRQLESLLGYQEKLNSNVTVEWNGQQKTTKIESNTTEPYWNEQLWFRTGIKDDEDAAIAVDLLRSQISIQCWDNESFSKNPLGYKDLDFLRVFRERKTRVFGGNGMTFKCLLDLDVPESYGKAHVSPTLEIEIFFTPDVKLSRLSLTDFGSLKKKSDALALSRKTQQQEYIRALFAWRDIKEKMEKLSATDSNRSLKRFFHAEGIDEQTGTVYWLPRFLGELHPPAGLAFVEDILHFVNSIQMEHKMGPALAGKSKVRKKMDSEGTVSREMDKLQVWSDPYYFLEKRKGDVKDHAILLCNFLLARMMDAYVCIGSAKTGEHESCEHVWVMTRDHLPAKDGSDRIDKVIRFWETTSAKIYTLRACGSTQRFNEVSDGDGIFLHEDSVRVSHESEEGAPPGSRSEAPSVPAGAASMPTSAFEATDHSTVQMSEAVPSAQPTVTSPRSRSNLLRRSRAHMNNEPEETLVLLDLGVGVHLSPNEMPAQQISPGSQSNVIDENFSVFAEKIKARERFESDTAQEQELRLRPLEIPEFEAAKQEVNLPYRTIDVVFNDHVLFANVQNNDPAVISYNMHTERNRWYQFPFKRTEKRHLPFYRKKPLHSHASAQEIKATVSGIARIVRVALSQHREYSGDADADETVFFPNSFLPSIDARLEIEEEYAYNRGEGLKDSAEINNIATRRRLVTRWQENLERQLPPGFRYVERLFRFKHSDASRISDSVIQACADNILALSNAQMPQYVVRCRIEKLPCYVCPVRLLVACVFRPTEFT